MSEPKGADNRIEGIISKWEMFYVSFTKFDSRVQSPRQFYHLQRQVDADRARATICSFGCKSARPGRDVQQPCAGAQAYGIEDGGGGQGGHRCKKGVIALCQSIMTLAFEGPQSLRLAAG